MGYGHFAARSPNTEWIIPTTKTPIKDPESDIAKSNCLITPEITHVITEFDDLPHEELPDKQSLTYNIQPTLELVLEVRLPYFSVKVVIQLENCETTTTLDVNQQCLVSTDIRIMTHFGIMS